jgi:predicted MFS family arabinose efflux permease
MNTVNQIDKTSSLVSACAMGAAGVMLFGVLPLLLGAIADHFQLDEGQAGMVAMAYFGGFFLATLTSIVWIRRVNWKLVSITALFLIATGMVVGAWFTTFNIVLIGVVLSGAGGGAAYALSAGMVSDMDDPDRKFAIKLIPEQILPAVLLMVLPAFVIPIYGLGGFLVTVAAVSVALILFVVWVPAKGKSPLTTEQGGAKASPLVIVGLLALLFYFGGIAGVWAFLERIANDGNMDPAVVGNLLVVALASTIVGPIVAAIVGDRFGRIVPQVVGTVIVLATFVLLAGEITVMKYGIVMALMPGAWYFVIAYQMGIIADADNSGRYAALMSSALGLGAFFGGPIVGSVAQASGFASAYIFAGTTAVIGTGLSCWLVSRLRERLNSEKAQVVRV